MKEHKAQRHPNISLPESVKQELDRLKILPEEPYWKVIKRIMEERK